MELKIVGAGNSRAIHIPQTLLDKAGLDGKIELQVVEDGILIQKASDPQAGWAGEARPAHERGDGTLMYEYFNNEFDETEWVWE